MPELPEVEVCGRQLWAWSAGRPLAAVLPVDRAVVRTKLSTRPSDAAPDGRERLEALVGRRAELPLRHGKRLAWSFGDTSLLVHLGMTGRWVRRPEGDAAPDLARLGLRFGGEWLWFLDGRRFGCVVVVPSAQVRAMLRDGAGPDALTEPLDGPGLATALAGRRAIKVSLMDQARLAGLGNIHAAEACFRAGLAPDRPGSSLDEADWERLAAAVVTQLEETLADVQPTEEMLYVSEGGDNPFAVYKRDGLDCPRCGARVTSAQMGGRTTYWCPSCQS